MLQTFSRSLATHWTDDNQPIGITLDALLYRLRQADAADGLLFDSVTLDDLSELADAGPVLFDALITTGALLERKIDTLKRVMTAASTQLDVTAAQVSPVFKRFGVVNVAAIFELSDGQTISAVFHNPDAKNVKSLKPSDDLISWKWLLNKRDVTIVVAPEQGTDLPIRQVARRLMSLAEKNSRAFQRLNTKRAERLANIDGLKTEIKELETELDGLTKAIDIARLEAEERAMNPQPVVEPEPAVEPEPTQSPLPWDGATTEDETRWYGSTIRLTAIDRKDAERGLVREGEATLSSVLNGGKVLEVRWPGQDFSNRLSIRDRYIVEVLDLVDNKTVDQPSQVAPVVMSTISRPEPGRWRPQAAPGSAALQMEMANRAVRTALLTVLNEKAGYPYTEDEIVNAADDRIDAMNDYLLAKAGLQPPAPVVEPAVQPEPAVEPEPIPAQPDADKIAMVDSAYRFADASDAFKTWVAESVDRAEASPFATAKAMDEAAKRNGATIEWGLFGGATLDSVFGEPEEWDEDDERDEEPDEEEEDDDEPDEIDPDQMTLFDAADDTLALDSNPNWSKQPRDRKTGQWRLRRSRRARQAGKRVIEHITSAVQRAGDHIKSLFPKLAMDSAVVLDGIDQDGYVGKIRQGGLVVGRVDISDEGAAMVFSGDSGDERVEAMSPAGMVDALFVAAAETPADAIAREVFAIYPDRAAMESRLRAIGEEKGLRQFEMVAIADKVKALSKASAAGVEPVFETETEGEKTVRAVTQQIWTLLATDSAKLWLNDPRGWPASYQKKLKQYTEFGAQQSLASQDGKQVTIAAASVEAMEDGTTLIARQGKNETRIAIDKTSVPESVYQQVVDWFKGVDKANGDAFMASLAPSPDLDDPLVQDTLELFKAGNFNQQAGGNGPRTPELDAAYTKAAKAFMEGDMAVVVKPKKGNLISWDALANDANINPKPIAKAVKQAIKPADIMNAMMVIAPKDDVRYYLNGVKIEDGRLIAVDGHRVVFVKTDTAAWDDKQAPEGGNWDRIVGRDGKMIDGKFPDVDRVMRATQPSDVVVTVDAVKLASRMRGIIAALKAIDTQFSQIDLDVGGPKVPVKPEYLLDLAETFLRLGYKRFSLNSAGPAVALMATSEDGKVTQMLMPLRGDPDSRLAPIGAEVLAEMPAEPVAEPVVEPEIPPAPVPPAPTGSNSVYEKYVQNAADSIAALRTSDVYRVLSELDGGNVDGVTRDALAGRIAAQRPDLADEVGRVLGELNAEPAPTPTEDPQKTADRALFERVAAGLPIEDITPELMDDMIAAYERHQGDPEMEALAEQALDVYQAANLAAADAL